MMHTIGQKLKQAREAKRLTLEQVFEAIRIRVPYLRALEEDDLSAMPSPVQGRGYLRNYAEFLDLNVDQLLEEMRAEKQASDVIIGPADLTDQPAIPTPEPVSVPMAAPLSTPEPESVSSTEPPLEVPPPQDEIPLVKPKTTRRKKAESTPAADPSTTKRRGRKKAEPEPAPEIAPIIEPQPVVAAELVIPVEPEPVVESAVETAIEPQPEPIPPADVNEGLWQTWLNRLSAAIAARKANKKETPQLESFQSVQSVDAENPQPSSVPTETTIESASKESIQIFKEIGVELRTRRELLSLNIAEVERNTHVKAHYIEALEHGEMDNLPSTVQTRGMLSNYATFLDLDVDAILLRYADALQARHREKNPQKPPRKAGQPIVANLPNLTNFIAGDMIFGVGMAILLVGFSIWGVSRVMTLQSEQDVEPTAPSISDVLLASPDASAVTATATFQEEIVIPGQPTETIVIPTLSGDANVQVNLVAVERTYLRVTVDGDVKFDGRVLPGNAYPFDAEEQIEVLVGSGAAIRVVYNGQDLGFLGTFGQVVSTIYRADEIITPTALPSAIPTDTLTPTATLTPSRTPLPSNTPNATNTPNP
jgi:cytoskeletal protein RodZ